MEFDLPGFWVKVADDSDYAFAMECVEESAWNTLEEGQRTPGMREKVIAQARDQAVRIMDGDMPNDLYVLMTDGDERAGILWMGVMKHSWTGADMGWILDIFVAERFRGQGLGGALMRLAERWTIERGLTSLGLAVGAANMAAVHLYERIGMRVETLQMRKDL